MKQWRDRSLVFLTGVIFVVLSVSLLEWYFGSLLAEGKTFQKDFSGFSDHNEQYFMENPPKYGIFPPEPKVPDSEKYTGPAFPPIAPNELNIIYEPDGCHIKSRFMKKCREIRKSKSGLFIWDVTYELDEFQRRITPGEDQKKTTKFLLTIGDSNVFGSGITQKETKSFYFGEQFPDYRVYNYGVAGAYPGEVMKRIQLIKTEEIQESEGIALYFLLYHNIYRVMGHLNELALWSNQKAYYYINDQDEVVTNGSFSEEKPHLVLLSHIALNSNIFKYFRLHPVPDDKDLRLIARIIEETRKAVEKNGVKRFYVVVGPSMFPIPTNKLYRQFEELKINYIDIVSWNPKNFVRANPYVPYDGHPSGALNEKLVEELAKVIKKDLKNKEVH